VFDAAAVEAMRADTKGIPDPAVVLAQRLAQVCVNVRACGWVSTCN